MRVFFGFLLLCCATHFRANEPHPTPRRVKVLFLGDNSHHTPMLRLRQLYTPMALRGIDFTYTDRAEDLNADTLSKYDCLLLYANIESATPQQEKALLDYVNSGHGLVAVHCASACFKNSPKLIALIGARFDHHSTGVFKETIAEPEHPVERGLKPIECWDETYVHADFNEEGRTILGYRIEGQRKEPYTWVREQGKGRVFYTAWGHDERTWGNTDFQNLLERGIKWAAGDWALKPQPSNKPFEYTSGKLPNYIQGASWGTTGDAITKVQKPLSADESMRHMVVDPGFEVKLFACDPQITKPICMAFDERGRCWVAETFDYPNEMQPPGKGRDRITICEDTNGDGVADKFTVFADKLSIPTSIVFANGGVIVAQAPDILYLKNDHDHATERKVLFTGFGTRDTHAGPSNLRWGLDGWIYGTCGYSGFDGQVAGKHLVFGQGVFRFKPDGSAMEFIASTDNNTWGLGFTEDFDLVVSTANHNPAFYPGIPNRYYETVRGWTAHRPVTVADDWHFWPITEHVRQVDQFGGYTAGAGAAMYTARTFPSWYWNRVNFVADPTGHLIGQFEWSPRGAGLVAKDWFNLFAGDDEWCAPISPEVGPDGAVWFIDWYNIIVQHNPIPKGFVAGKGGAYETNLRDHRHGRIYRIVWEDGTPSKQFDLTHATTEQLVAALKSDNMLWRSHAQRLLMERGDVTALGPLFQILADKSVSAAGMNAPVVHALWALKSLALENATKKSTLVLEQLHHPSAAVRKTALAVLPRIESNEAELLRSGVLSDPSPAVRREALLAVSEMPPSDAAGEAICEFLQKFHDDGDYTLKDAAVIAAARHDAGFLKAAFAVKPNGATRQAIAIVSSHYARRTPTDSVVATLAALKGANPDVAVSVIEGINRGWTAEVSPPLDGHEIQQLKSVLAEVPQPGRFAMLMLVGKWGQAGAFETQRAAMARELRDVLQDARRSTLDRIDAAHHLIAICNDDATAREFVDLIQPNADPTLQLGMINALASCKSDHLGALLVQHWKKMGPTAQRAAGSLMLRRYHWAAALLDGIERSDVNPRDLAKEQWQALVTFPEVGLSNRAKALQQSTGLRPSEGRKEIVDRLIHLADVKGDTQLGKQVFEKNCMVCHTLDGRGGKVGPELTGIGARPKSENLLQILDPNRSVEGTFREWTATTKDGEFISGRLMTETATAIELLDTAGKTHSLQRSELKNLTVSDRGLMPEGFEALKPGELSAVVEYLATSKVKH